MQPTISGGCAVKDMDMIALRKEVMDGKSEMDNGFEKIENSM